MFNIQPADFSENKTLFVEILFSTMTSKSHTFLEELNKAHPTECGVFLFPSFVMDPSACLEFMDSDAFPWDTSPRLFGEKLPQHAYLYKRSTDQKFPALSLLEDLCRSVEKRFDGTVSAVYCNRFCDSTHRIDWHADKYGQHIFVLTLGSSRVLEFRNNKTDKIESLCPTSGDLYFMPLHINTTHMHRVLPGDNGTRLSFVFFFDPPKYAKEYRITTRQRIRGFLESMFE
jgi:hypothetical protein